MTAILERVLIVFNADGTFKGAHAEDARGLAMPVTGAQLASVLPQVGDLMGRVQSAEAEAASLGAQIAAVTAERDTLKGQAEAAARAARTAVSPAQARLALKSAGLLATVEAMMEALPKDDDARIVWDYAVAWERHSPFIATLGGALGLQAHQIDDLFALAATL